MSVHALVTTIGTSPEPSVLLVLDGIDEVFADLLGRASRVSVLAGNDLAQLLFVPVVHGILLLHLILILLHIPRIGVQILLGSLTFGVQVMAELALTALFTVALLVENTDNGLGVDTKRNLLHLDRLEQLCRLLLGVGCGLLLGFNASLFSCLSLIIRSNVGLILGFHLFDLSLGLSTFFLHAEVC